MLTRRDVLFVAGAALARQRETRMAIPRNACDSHIHVIGDRARFPFSLNRVYTPAEATVAQSRSFHRDLGTTRTVVVQPSVYGADNSCLIDALKQLGASARGIAVIDPTVTDADLDAMNTAGVRGVRVNTETAGVTDPNVGRQRVQAALARVSPRNWHVQVFTRLSIIERVQDIVQNSTVPIVFDHFGGARGELGVGQPGFDVLVQMVKSGKAYVKISGAYRSSNAAPDYAEMAPFAKALIDANPERIVWGTDWPHVDSATVPGRLFTDTAPHLKIDDRRLLDQLAVWAPDPAQRQRILVDNPARLYGF